MKRKWISNYMNWICFWILFLSASLPAVDFYSSATVPANATYDTVRTFDTPPNSTTLEFYGAAYNLIANDNSTVNIRNDGWFTEMYNYSRPTNLQSSLHQTSTVNVYSGGGFGGGSNNIVRMFDFSTMNVYGGIVYCFVTVENQSTLNVYSGSVMYPDISDNATINVYGGYMGCFYPDIVPDSATINIYGYGFQYNPQASWDSLINDWLSLLTGFGMDGTPITYVGLPDPATHSNINLIPEPVALSFLLLGSFAVLKPKKYNRNL